MVRQLVVANEAVCRTAREVLDVSAKGDDAPTEDLLTQRLQTHEQYAWMLLPAAGRQQQQQQQKLASCG
ncbi:hypothetical protein G6F32_016481 [Rhizopus arrhizus]|nr:hypothetical protein G6F32_016481 [Rhizopus arrhizus]